MSNLTIEDLAALINQAPKAKKPRKKAEQTPEQRELMLEKLALMREKSLEKRNAKKAEVKAEPVIAEPKAKPQPKAQLQVQAPPQPQAVQPNNDLFEKHYNSKFERLEESISGINNSINQMKQLKLEKAELKKKKAEEKAQQEEKNKESNEEGLSQVKTQSQGDVVQPTPPQNLNPNRIMRPNVNYKSFFKR